MPHQFTVDDDLAALVEKLAKPRPFENLSFNAALRRVLFDFLPKLQANEHALDGNALLAELMAATPNAPKKALSPSSAEWAAGVAELHKLRDVSSWDAICKALGIETKGDSARRKVQRWVVQYNLNPAHKKKWPEVPDA